jgi:hypothetical protein
MPSKDENIAISLVPVALIPALWGRIYAHVRRGAEIAGLSPSTATERLLCDLDQLWIITEGNKVIGAFVTTFCREGEGGAERRFVGVSNLSGQGAKRWAAAMCDLMAYYARANGCAYVRCYGRQAWSRLLPNVSIIGQHENGHAIFERSV